MWGLESVLGLGLRLGIGLEIGFRVRLRVSENKTKPKRRQGECLGCGFEFGLEFVLWLGLG